MSIELSILNLFCKDREVETINYGYIKTLPNLEKELNTLFKLVHAYYKEHDKVDAVNKDELFNFYEIKFPKARDRDLHVELINRAYDIEIQPDLVKQSLDQVIERHTATMIVNKLLPVMEGEKYGILESITGDVDNYIDLLHNPPDSLVVPTPCGMSIEDLVAQEIHDAGIPWHLPILDNIIGGLRMKTLGLIYAFVDSGKTSFALSAAAAFAAAFAGTTDRIAYAGNEEAAPRLKLRFIQALLNWTRGQISAQTQDALQHADEHGLNNVDIFDSVTTGHQVEYILKEYAPKILFVDQATDVDIDTKRKSDGVEYLKQLFKYYRRLAGTYNCAIIGVAQGVGDAERTKWLKLSDIYGSRVAIQGALDYALGIGRVLDDPAQEDLRFINVPKNKLHDGRGDKFTTHFQRTICRFQEV
jgi:hypothetical protein